MSRTRKHELTGAKKFTHSCRNHGSCNYCRSNRMYNELRDKEHTELQKKEELNQYNTVEIIELNDIKD